MENAKVSKVLSKTMPYLLARVGIYLAIAAVSIVWIFIGIGLAGLFGNEFGLIGVIIVFAGLYAIVKIAGHYFLYFVKIGHISVINEYLMTGDVPKEGQFQHGIDTVKNNLGTSAAVASLDLIIRGAVRQVIRWLNRIENLFNWIPGMDKISDVFNKVVETAANYIDECILGYILLKKKEDPESDVWKDAANGIVLYAGAWKKIAVASVKAVAIVYLLNLLLFFLLFLALGALVDTTGFLPALLIAGSLTWAISKALIDPIATITLMVAYYKEIEGKEPSPELQAKMEGASKKFKEIVGKAKNKATSVMSPKKNLEETTIKETNIEETNIEE